MAVLTEAVKQEANVLDGHGEETLPAPARPVRHGEFLSPDGRFGDRQDAGCRTGAPGRVGGIMPTTRPRHWNDAVILLAYVRGFKGLEVSSPEVGFGGSLSEAVRADVDGAGGPLQCARLYD